ncbi:hypothetical protein [Oceanispirochaeta sp.]|uniref:hypothetical protein n=1 Tax=Oceanispirochaeta sp. TaxID=2035350 RepID=UPI0026106A56|nr:hypothetical protein [Oceanispirochaeta sp.]MDA3955481.1 hypothetical protein [Oceanispirochaeta sp.]
MIQVEKKLSDLNIAIHPNDGSDLNLFTLKHNFIFYAGTSLDEFKSGSGQLGEGTLQLLNDCPHGTLQVSEMIAVKLAWTQKALLILDDRKIYLTYSDQMEF